MKQFFYMRRQSTKCQWQIEKPLTFSGIWENFVQPLPLQCTQYYFQIFRISGSATGKEKNYLHFRTRFCHLRFVIYDFFLNPEFHKFIKLLRWMKTRKGLTFLCCKNELGHKRLLLIVFGIRNYRLPISFLSIHPF